MNLTTEFCHLKAKLEELRVEFHASNKGVDNLLATKAETSWADYKHKICV